MAKLLIVDDEKNIRGHLARFFRERGYDAQTAESGPQALAMFSDHAAEVVLTDYRMAEMNGHELLKRIRERDPNVMVILMTAYVTVENAVAAMKEGAYDYLTKPFSLEQFEHTVERALETQRLRNDNLLIVHNFSLQAGFAQIRNEALRNEIIRRLHSVEHPRLQREFRIEAHDVGGLRMRLLHHPRLDVRSS